MEQDLLEPAHQTVREWDFGAENFHGLEKILKSIPKIQSANFRSLVWDEVGFPAEVDEIDGTIK